MTTRPLRSDPSALAPDAVIVAVERLWGSGRLDLLFGGGLRAPTPWPSAPRNKSVDPTRRAAAVAALLGARPRLTAVDPRALYAGQPWLVRHHVSHYSTGEWERTGTTSADHHVELNRFPVVVPDHRGRLVIVSGHHRAAAALLAGRELLVRTNASDGRTAVTPTLLYDPHGPAPARDVLVATIRAGGATTTSSRADVAATLASLGLTPIDVEHRLAHLPRLERADHR